MRNDSQGSREEGGVYGRFSFVVHSLRVVLAVGTLGAGAISLRVAGAAAIPAPRDCRDGRPRLGSLNHFPSSTPSAGPAPCLG